jgi:UDP-N-acetylmuramoylalanine--D-glutamate ligase
MNYSRKSVTVMGLGHFGGGVAAARWLARQGARVTLTDIAAAEELAAPLAALCDVEFAAVHLGGHRSEDFRNADAIVVNPAVHPDNQFMAIARRCGARLTTEIELFMEACPARIIGVTGSNGKSTTAAMIAAVLRADGRRVWLGGNIGVSLLPELDKIAAGDFVVLELSSFQLAYLDEKARMPHVGVVVNFTPNHLNWHGTLENYREAKIRLIAAQTPQDHAVLDASLLQCGEWAGRAAGRLAPPFDPAELPPLQTPGEHNRRNAALAAAAARAAGCGEAAVRRGLSEFTALPGRLERVASVAGRAFYNDTTSTTPESTVAALAALDSDGGATWLLAGGSDKGADYEEMAAAIVRHGRGAGFFGRMAEPLQRLTAEKSPHFPAVALETLAEALQWCWQRSRPGDRIVLSPGCASLDQFRNFRARGEKFIELIGRVQS